MAIDRASARRRVKAITAWSAAGAAALTAGFAFGASRSNHVAKATATPIPSETTSPQDPGYGGYGTDQGGNAGQGFAPPTNSTSPPSGMSGGS